ncbi:MAG: hypothetical protein ACO1OQ_13305 [Rufibacter sp.]
MQFFLAGFINYSTLWISFPRRITLVLSLFAFFFNLTSTSAQTVITSIKKGNFSDSKTWDLNRQPTASDVVVIKHDVNFNVSEFWIGQNGKAEMTITSTGSLEGAGKLIVTAKNSLLTNNGSLQVGHLQFGINGNDSAFFLNNGTATFLNNDELQRGRIQNNGTLTFNSNVVLHNITFKNALDKTTTFQRNLHINVGATLTNLGTVVVNGTADDALNLNQGTFKNYGKTEVKGRFNLASGSAATSPNYLKNYKEFIANRVYMNNLSSITNWGTFTCTNDFTNNQGIILNYPCAVIQQTTAGKTFENRNNGAVFTNNGFVTITGNFTNIAQALLNGTGTIHVTGYSMNSDQGKVEGTLCFYDASAISGHTILDEATRNNATIAATVLACATNAVPVCPVTDGKETVLNCKNTNSCFDFTYLGYVENSNSTVTLSFKVKTNCQNALSNVAFQLPAGAVAQNPSNANPAFKYTIENTTNQPFYSIKFEATTAEGFKNGAEDTFTYTVTAEQFNSLSTFKVQAKAANSVGDVSFTSKTCCPLPLEITQQPVSATAIAGNATFKVQATGTEVAYQWQVKNANGDWVNLANGNSSTLTLTGLADAQHGQMYRAVISSGCGEVISSQEVYVYTLPTLALNLRVFLEGPYNTSTGLMNTTLNSSGYLPNFQPYNFNTYNYKGKEKVGTSFFSTHPDIVDWVLVEIRTELDPRLIISKKACLLKNDGYIVDLDGISLPRFLNVVSGNYFIVINHRNHVPIISKKLVSLTSAAPVYDFSLDLEKAAGIYPQKQMATGRYVMYAGDANGSASVTTADWNECWIRDQNKTGYQLSDFNLDGKVDVDDYKYMWLSNNGKVTQTPR